MMYEGINPSALQKDIESLLRRIGQEKYFSKALPELLDDFCEMGEVSSTDERYHQANQFLYLSGWYFSDCSRELASMELGLFLH